MKLAVFRLAATRAPNANSSETAFMMLKDNESIVHIESFDNRLYLIVQHETESTEIDKRFFGADGRFDFMYAPEWLPLDPEGNIYAAEGESQVQAFTRHWDEREAS